jgi:hypothetical protein
MALSHLEARVRIYQAEIPGLEEEPRMAGGGIRLVNLYVHRKRLVALGV